MNTNFKLYLGHSLDNKKTNRSSFLTYYWHIGLACLMFQRLLPH